MLAHPPLLYLGYVGLTIPFAFAMGALLARRTDELWIVATRRWTLLAWTFLGVGQLLGAHWAYVEIGWGGYYAWDPVENAALMPWLAATAFLHSVMIQEKRGMLKVWNVLLVIGAFCLSLFGTFLTRSGVLNSIHSFTQSSIGPWFLGFIAFVTAASLALVFSRLALLRSRTRLESLVSREATFLYNNLLLVALCLTILWGVIYPILSEAVRGETVTVGAPYYNFFLRIFGLPLLLLMGIGPLVAWRRASLRSLGRTFAWPAAVALATGVVLLVLGAGSSTPGADRLHVLGLRARRRSRSSSRAGRARGTRPRRELAARVHVARRAQPAALRRLHRARGDRAARDRHRRLERVRLEARARSSRPGQSHGRRGLHARRTERPRYAHGAEHRRGARADRRVRRGGDVLGTLHPGKNYYYAEEQTSREVAIRSDYLTGEDLFLIADQINEGRQRAPQGVVKPLVNLIWLAGLVFIFGSVVAMWPDAREERRLATRYGERRPRARDASRSCSRPCSPSRRSSSSRCRSCASRMRRRSDRLDGVDALERRRLALLEERDRALGGALGARARPPHRARSPTRTTARRSARCGPARRPRCRRSTATASPPADRSPRQPDERIFPAVGRHLCVTLTA